MKTNQKKSVKFRPWKADKTSSPTSWAAPAPPREVNMDCSHQFSDITGRCSKCAAVSFVSLVDVIYDQIQKSGDEYEARTGNVSLRTRNILKNHSSRSKAGV